MSLSCILVVLAMFLDIVRRETSKNVPPLCTHYENNSNSSPGLLCYRFNNLSILLHKMYVISSISSVQYRSKFFQIWSTIAGYDEQNILNEYCNENFYFIYG